MRLRIGPLRLWLGGPHLLAAVLAVLFAWSYGVSGGGLVVLAVSAAVLLSRRFGFHSVDTGLGLDEHRRQLRTARVWLRR